MQRNTLKELKTGESAVISNIKGRGKFRKRLTEMGFVRGKEVTVVRNAPLRDPIEYKIMGYNVSLRRDEAEHIEVFTPEDDDVLAKDYLGTHTDGVMKSKAAHVRSHVEVVFVGNPNAGKTTLYNTITGGREHVGNYSGVTVDAKQSNFTHRGVDYSLTDLPGTYSLSPNSPDEIFVRDHILNKHPDVVVNVIDASNLERNLYLTAQLIDMDIKVVIALNMYDELEKNGDILKIETFSKLTGIPLVPTVGSRGRGIVELMNKIEEVHDDQDDNVRHIHINYGEEIEKSIEKIQSELWKSNDFTDHYSSRYFAIRLLEKDKHTNEKIESIISTESLDRVVEKEIHRLEIRFKNDTETLITDARYGFISGALKECFIQKRKDPSKLSRSERVDKILTGQYTGFPIFIIFLYVMFQSTFSLGAYPAEWIEWGITGLSHLAGQMIPSGIVHDLVVDGIIGGVGGVLVFLPNILILFFFISLMEDTGYMARVSFIMDRLMHLLGLHGKSFIPLIMGFGCNVPAIMATRTLENRNDRLLTMLILPFMSCSARLPVYILIAGAIFPQKAALIIFAIYLLGVVLSIFSALLFKNTIIKKSDIPFVMELPPYRIPTTRNTLLHMWNKASQYLKKMTGIILWASIIIWFLSYFPRTNDQIEVFNSQKVELQQFGDLQDDVLEIEIHNLDKQIAMEQQNNSYLGRVGHAIEPVIAPLGFDWRIGVSLLCGIAAKEVVVSTMGVIYSGEGALDENSDGLRHAIQTQTYTSGPRKGELIFTSGVAMAFLVFVLIYIPCVAVVGAIKKESGKWRWAIFSIVYTLVLAWVAAFLTLQLFHLFT